MTGIEIFCGIVAVLLLFYYYSVANYNIWKRQGVSGPKPIPLLGNMAAVLFSQMSIGDYTQSIYRKYKSESMVGVFMRRQPALVINDPELIKTVLIKDFPKFSNRGVTVNEVAEPLSQNLFSLEPKRWRPLRTRFTPVFTTGRLKEMFGMIVECVNSLEKHLGTLVAKGDPIDCRELAAKYTTDVIGYCAFGVNMNAISNEESKFREVGREFFSTSFLRVLRIRLKDITPKLYTLLGYILPYSYGTDFFMNTVLNVMEHRKKNKIVRNDFINTLIETQAHPEKLGDIELTDSLLAAQAFVFFLAGFETSSITISNALYELALHQDIQDKLREEINEHYEINNEEWHYENVKKMPVLDAIFKETLRKYPPLTVLTRKPVENYTFEDMKVSIPKDTTVFIPVYGIHHDPDIYPNPEVFDIDRFKDDAHSKRHPMHYLPFGDGPRNCIGARFAVFQSKIGLIKIIRDYKVDVCEQTVIPYKINPRAFFLAPDHPITLKVTKIQS
ncbi:cytochrome P450 6A1 [Halictus rubicundus]|uniref:cytochrome P450 6A1 n=1 Tax=Halictus rubicundus TaxID=77578 RepID=UPI00403696B3